MLLEISNIEIHHGHALAIKQVDLRIKEGQLVALIGPNGAGKTTLMRAISGFIKPTRGHIKFRDVLIDGLPAFKISRMGIIQCPEGRRPFPEMTVEENLLLGNIFCRYKHLRNRLLTEIYALFPALEKRRKQVSGTLSGGEQQMLAIGRGLMSEPKLLLIDELSLGLAPIVVDEIFSQIMKVREKGMNILLVEQMVDIVLDIADNVFVLEQGEIAFSGSKELLLKDSRLREIYLGLV